MKPVGSSPKYRGSCDAIAEYASDATAEQIVKSGGQVRVPAKDIPGVGRFGVFTDPQGAAIAAFTPIG